MRHHCAAGRVELRAGSSVPGSSGFPSLARLLQKPCAPRCITVARDLRLESVPEPQAGPGDVKLRVLYNGICGSDLHEYYDGPVTTRTTPHPLTGVKNPVILGHELCGEVVALGAGVEDLALGDLVAVDPLESCGGCLWCLAGQYNHCPLVALHGYNRGGRRPCGVHGRAALDGVPPGARV
jgi:(R,R)-butanediol dehydrogenase/meso-butanediol dehydrogenase/diacetyl reductase